MSLASLGAQVRAYGLVEVWDNDLEGNAVVRLWNWTRTKDKAHQLFDA